MKQLLLKRRLIRPAFKSRSGQASAELAIMGAIVLMLLGYLISQGLSYNNRQALEMYTFRKALQLSKNDMRSVSLTVMRDVISPTFMMGLSRQRLMASSAMEYNPYKLYTPKENEPQDVASRQLIQINDGMIKKSYFFEVPPTLVKVAYSNQTLEDGDSGWRWATSSIAELDSQVDALPRNTTTMTNTTVTETSNSGAFPGYRRFAQNTTVTENIPTVITFEGEGKIISSYRKDDWAENIKTDADAIQVNAATIPRDVALVTEETIRRTYDVRTPHQ